ncbi:MAG: hypothetical protein EOP05_07435 [Proteobacteria bacterium]|nr:MAG: hypothetical protein EOP05_07435 [Pseudomonadota bacterium]
MKRFLLLTMMTLQALAASVAAPARASSLERWQGHELESMFKASERAPLLPPNQLRKMIQVYQKKCAVLSKSESCFVSEEEVGLSKNTENRLLFRGEPGSYSLPMTSPVLREALKGSSLCGHRCDEKKLSHHLDQLVKNLIGHVAKQIPGFYGGHTFDDSRNLWELDSRQANPLFEDKKKPSANEVLINAHFRGGLQTLKVDRADGGDGVLDPFVSYSASPEIAHKFGSSFDRTGKIWLISVPRMQFHTLTKKECRKPIDRIGIYDLTECSRPRVYKGEQEYDAFLYPPASTVLGYFRSN